jgi:hypothetical protein
MNRRVSLCMVVMMGVVSSDLPEVLALPQAGRE